MQSSLRLDTITMMDNSTHVASSPDARSPKLNHKFEAQSTQQTPKFG